MEVQEADFEPDFLQHIFPRIQWAALCEAAAAMGERPLGQASHSNRGGGQVSNAGKWWGTRRGFVGIAR